MSNRDLSTCVADVNAEHLVGQVFLMRTACRRCGSTRGNVVAINGQNVVRCECGLFQYNAPKVETGQVSRSVTTVHNGIKPKQRARILARDGGACVMCHAANRPLHVGHLLSVEAGLSVGLTEAELNHDDNLGSMCEECNLGLGPEPIPLRIYAAILQIARRGINR